MKLRNSAILTPMSLVSGKVKYDPLSPMALMFHKPDSNIYIVTVLGTNRLFDLDHLKANLGEFVLSHPRLYSLQVEDTRNGGLKWVQTEVDLDKHIISPNFDPSLITSSPEKFLEDYLYDLSKTTIDMSKPLWDIHILNGLKASIHTESTCVLRIHHSLGDGMSLMSLMLALAKRTSNNQPLSVTKANKTNSSTRNVDSSKTKKNSIFMKMARYETIRKVWWMMWYTMVDVIYFLATIFFLKDTKNPFTPLLDVGDYPKRIVQRTVSLDDIKLIARATKTTVNDVIMGVTEAGLSRYLENIYEGGVPRSMRLRAAVFFNIRFLSGVQGVEDMKENGSLARWGNQIGSVFYPFKIGLRRNPVEHVHSAKRTMDRKKTSLESYFSYWFISIMLKLLGIKAVKFSRNVSLYFSNMMGPKEGISLFGYPITYVATSCHGAPSALSIHVISYVDRLTFSLAVDERSVPNPHQLCDDLEESLNIIKGAVLLAQEQQNGCI